MKKVYINHMIKGTGGACRFDATKKRLVVSIDDRIQLNRDPLYTRIVYMVQRYEPASEAPEKVILDAIKRSLNGDEIALLLTEPSTQMLGAEDYMISAVFSVLSPNDYEPEQS